MIYNRYLRDVLHVFPFKLQRRFLINAIVSLSLIAKIK